MSVSTIRVSSSVVTPGAANAARRRTGLASASALMTVSCSVSSGNSLCTRLTASRTSAAARSRSASGEKTTRIRKLFSSLEDRISWTPVTRAIAPSTRLVTSASMVSGDAPGSSPRTETVGRSTLGSSRTSTAKSAAKPASAIRRFITNASRGRRTLTDGKSSRGATEADGEAVSSAISQRSHQRLPLARPHRGSGHRRDGPGVAGGALRRRPVRPPPGPRR